MTIHSDIMARSNNSNRSIITDKREAILRAAIKVFARNGYFNSKVSDIAGEAGIADGTVYLYFKSKEEVLHSVFDTFMEEFLNEAKRELSEIENPIERLKKLARLHLEKLGNDRDAAIVVQVEFRGSTKFMEEFSNAGFAEYLKMIKQTIEDGQQQGLFRQDLSATICSKILYGALDEMVTNWILSKKQYALAPMANTVLEIFFGGLNKK
ncbi:MAG: TetR family transcriptional regulator [Pyrinomonadaceae bacterium]|jgi:TetR/AcrR family transcriptional regulator, fatty acid metabolism regulator protein|nr:TetR family transcriptional regulator [Pyrinomonadaceae bacterium]